MKHCVLFFFLISLLGSAQQNVPANRVLEHEETEEGGQKKSQERFYKLKYDPAVKNYETERWKAFRESKSALFKTQATPVANWQSQGPSNQAGKMLSCAFDPTNTSVFYAGSSTGGLWKTTNSGNSWTALTDNLPSLSVGAVAVNPQNSNMLLIGTGEGFLISPWLHYGSVGVLKSTDGGLTWNTTGLSFPDSLKFASLGFVWDPINTNRVCIATTFGVYVSTDAGDNWTLKLPGAATAIEINKKDPKIIFASLQNYQTSVGGIYRSLDTGNTWQPLPNLPPSSSIGFTSLSICDSFPNVIYAGISEPEASVNVGKLKGFYKSSNGGNNWTLMPPSYDFYCYPAPFSYVCQGWFANVTKVSPVDTNIVWAGGIYLYRSNNGGNTWNYMDYATLENPPYLHPDHHALAFDPNNSNKLYSLNDGGVYRTTNGGSNWVKVNNGLVTTQFYTASSSQTNPNLIIGGTQDNGIWYNYNTGSTNVFNQYHYGDGFASFVDHTNASILYGSELVRGRMRSRNGGVTNDTINTGLTEGTTFIIPMVMHPSNNSILFTATDAKIYRSVDSGSVWHPVYNAFYITILEIDPVNPNIIYGCSDPTLNNSYIYRSTNGGTNWIQIGNPGDKVTDIQADPITSGILYACRSKYSLGKQVYRSIDFGNTWTSISSGLPGMPANTIAISLHNNNHLYVGTDLGVYLSTDAGLTWSSFNDNLPNVIVQDMHYYSADTTLRCGTYGRGIWKTKAADPFITVNIKDVSQSSTLKPMVYPNPTSNSVSIEYVLTHNSKVNIRILDQLGQEVISLTDLKQDKGQHSINWDCRNTVGQKITAGVYYIRLTLDKIAYSEKIVFLK
ncbi:MAG: T9SS type A sorting domain-containing protein [Bacteroidota bacterium]